MEENFLKIINATYKILDFFPDDEPLKKKAKEKTLAVLDNLTLINGIPGWVSFQKEMASAIVLDDIEILETYLKLGRYQGWIDGVNFLILIKEYDQIKNSINPPKGFIKKGAELMTISASSVKKQSKNIDNLKIENSGNIETKVYSEKQDYNLGKNSLRQSKILEILNVKEKVQVADIIKEIPNITKRTIRRDLDELLKKGEIIRNGQFNQVSYQIYPVKSARSAVSGK